MVKRKEAMTAFDIAAFTAEASRGLRGARLVNVYEILENTFLFRFRGAGDYRVVAEPGRRVHLTSYDVSGKGQPPPFVMGLRKYVRGVRVKDVRQVGFERIVDLEFENGYHIYVEVLPRGVLALTDPSGVILQVNEQREMKDRVIRRGVRYTLPPPVAVHPRELNADEVLKKLEGRQGEAVRVLVRALGYPGEVVEEVLHRVGVEKTSSVSELLKGRQVVEEIVEEIRRLYEECLQGKGYIVYDEHGLVLTVTPFKPTAFGEKIRVYDSFSRAVDEYFVELEKARLVEESIARLEEEKARLEAMIRKTEELIREYGRKRERLERIAQLVAENAQVIDEAVECARRMREKSGWDFILGNCQAVVDVNPQQGVIRVDVGGETIDVPINLDSSRLILELYKRVGELGKKEERARRALEDLKRKLEALSLEIVRVERRARARVRRRAWYEKYHWMFTSNWILVIGGRDASQNESIVKRYLGDDDIFMHADIRGAPAVILFVRGRSPPEQDLREAAVLAACYSRAWKERLGAVDVYWVWGRQVSKAAPPGEYLTKGAFMVYGKRNYIRNVELKLAIGLGEEDETPVVLVGPRELVRRRSLVYALLAPGDEDVSKLAKRLMRLWRDKLGEKSYLVEAIEVDEIVKRVPGPARILEVGRGEARESPRPREEGAGEEG